MERPAPAACNQAEASPQPTRQAHLAFHLMGKRLPNELEAIDDLALRPALLAGYGDLTRLRYDFPLVLVSGGGEGAAVQSLSGLIDTVLKQIGDGVGDGGIRSQALRLEREIRTLAAECDGRLFSDLWDAAAHRLKDRDDDLLHGNLNRLRAALAVDGMVVDCNSAMPARLCRHVWRMVHENKAHAFGERIDRLIIRLSDILRADDAHSKEGRSPERLRASVGATRQEDFDFVTFSRLLADASPLSLLSESRRQRIEWLLSVLSSQQSFPRREVGDKRTETAEPVGFVFDSCAEAIAAYNKRLPEVVELAKAMVMAEREIEGEYDETKHGAIFAELDFDDLDQGDLDLFPDYLICVRASDMRAEDNDRLLDALAAGFRAKVLVETDDILVPSPVAGDNPTFNWRSKQLATTAMGLNTIYVLQSSSSHLFQLRDEIVRAMACPGPALFSVFSVAAPTNPDFPPYLTAAAAMESRGFPAFTYDPSAGPDWASQFRLQGNPQIESDWPVLDFAYVGEEHQKMSEKLAFTLIDFVVADPRYAKHFARVPRSKWTDHMVPLSEFLNSNSNGTSEEVPYVLAIDRSDMLHRVIVDDKLVREARRCAKMWHSLQELGGIQNSYAVRLVAEERKVWAEQVQQQERLAPVYDEPQEVTEIAERPAEPATALEPVEAQRQPEEPYIETARCTTCNECTLINGKMFAYNDNKQAFIADPDAGTYRELVEAAESCQVAIIHPGKPRNPTEPDLDDLIKRAEPFV